jgi:mobilome CxxCx(11)CxxC protein
MTNPSQNSQRERLRQARIRTYQTYIIFGKARFAKRGLKWLTFLGIVVPLLAGGIVLALYSDRKPPFELVAIAGLLGTLQAVASVWALVDEWERKAQLNMRTADEFRSLHIELSSIQPRPDGSYDEEALQRLETRSWGGLHPDEELGVTKAERDHARQQAERRYPIDSISA